MNPPTSTGPSRAAGAAGRKNPGHWVLVVLGVVLTGLGMGLTIAGAMFSGADAAQRGGRYLVTGPERFQSPGYALVSEPLRIDSGVTGWLPTGAEDQFVRFRVQGTSVVPGQEVFLGVAPAADTAGYLQGVPHTVLGDDPRRWAGPPTGRQFQGPDSAQGVRPVPGTRVPVAPGQQDFWVTSASGPGTQPITVEVQPGRWTLVVMNADASRPVWVDLQAGIHTQVLGPVGTGMLITGLIALVLGLPMTLWGTAGLGRDIDPSTVRRGHGPGATLAAGAPDPGTPGGPQRPVHPVRFTGLLGSRLSRWLWLVKWLLAIPHYIVLAVLWCALAVTTIAAGIAILITGRYPREWFLFSVGVLRWNWRVGFYAYSALGTDLYPPFTLAPGQYPAELDVTFPSRLSRGLVLVKSWLLAIPHLLILGIFTGAGVTGYASGWGEDQWRGLDGGVSLLGLLVLVAAVILLFTGHYHPGIFDLIMGLNRWAYRVAAYVLLLRDEYPPFHLDQGPTDPTVDLSSDPTAPAPGPDPRATG